MAHDHPAHSRSGGVVRSPLARAFGKLIAERRKAAGLGQGQVAEVLDVTQSTVSKWELGWAIPDLPTVLALADLLNFSVDDLRDCKRAAA